MLAALVVLTPSDHADAGKRKRSGSLERLRQRDVSERWQQLQETWRPIAEQPAEDVDSDAKAALANDEPPQVSPTIDGDNDQAAKPTDNGQSHTLRPVRLDDDALKAPTPRDVPHSVAGQPLWILEETVDRDVPDTHRTAVSVSLQSPADDKGHEPNAVDDARPRPITSILPYHDYSPDGEHPCEFLCPTPGQCRADDDAKPCPQLVELPDVPFGSRGFAESYVTWEASNLFSNPLYFEDASLERYGHTHNDLIQPLVSLGKFSVQFIGLPYQMALHPIHERRYALGWYRPGECAPYKYYLPPWNAKAAVTAGAVYTGLFYVIP